MLQTHTSDLMPSDRTPSVQVVVLSQVLAADVNVGYEDIVNTQASLFFMDILILYCVATKTL